MRRNAIASLREQALTRIRDMIFDGTLAPGARVSEALLAEEIGVSRTPIRSAVRELETLGFLEQVPRYGTVVKRLTRRDLEELYDLRAALEQHAAEAAATRLPAEAIEKLAALCERSEAALRRCKRPIESASLAERMVQADMKFHLAIYRGTGNRRLIDTATNSGLLANWSYQLRMPHRIDVRLEAWRQHAQIVECLASGDGDAARHAMKHHITFSADRAIERLEQQEIEQNTSIPGMPE